MNDRIRSKKSKWPFVLIGALALVAFLIGFFMLRNSRQTTESPELLRDGVRAGSPEFDRLSGDVVVGPPRLNIMERRAHGDRVLEIRSIVTNNSDQIISGLELEAILTNERGDEVGRKVIAPVNRVSTGRPAGELQTALRPGDSIDTLFLIEGVGQGYTDKNVKIQVTGIRVE
jgi:hypothetical protein